MQYTVKKTNTAPAAPLQNTKQAEAGKPLDVPRENTTLRRALMKSVMSKRVKPLVKFKIQDWFPR